MSPFDTFDPRAWNLFAGVALLAGCTARPSDGAADETAESGDNDLVDCHTDDDCYYGWEVCIEGACQFLGECFYDSADCCTFEVCEDFECVQVGSSLPECTVGWSEIPTLLESSSAPLALSFADVDDDGAAELVVATATQLLVYPFGADQPTVTERAAPSDLLRTMVAGRFDAQPGEDVILLLFEGEFHRYFSDGVAGFVNPVIEASPVSSPRGLLAGNFDGQISPIYWSLAPVARCSTSAAT
jgi:hypothetical protein